jgi:hypothetical protein
MSYDEILDYIPRIPLYDEIFISEMSFRNLNFLPYEKLKPTEIIIQQDL